MGGINEIHEDRARIVVRGVQIGLSWAYVKVIFRPIKLLKASSIALRFLVVPLQLRYPGPYLAIKVSTIDSSR